METWTRNYIKTWDTARAGQAPDQITSHRQMLDETAIAMGMDVLVALWDVRNYDAVEVKQLAR